MAFGLYDAFIDVGGGSAFTIGQISQCTRSDNVNVLKAHYSGGISPQALFTQSAEPRIQLVSSDLSGILTNISLSGGFAVTGAAAFPQIERADGGTFEATSNQYVLAKLCSYITSITAEGNNPAVANVDIMPLSTDGFVDPLSTETGQTLSSQVFNYEYGLGTSKIASTGIPGLTKLVINPGLQLTLRYYNGGPFPQESFIQVVEPTITWTFEKTDIQATIEMYYAIASTATAFLRRRTPGGTYVANATTSHIAFTLTGGIVVTDNISASGHDAGTFDITAHGKSLAVSLASAIS